METPATLSRIGKITSWLLILFSLTIIAGWQFRIPWMRGQAFGTFVAPTSGLSFLCSGLSVLLQKSRYRLAQIVGMCLAAFVTMFAAAVGAEYAFRQDLGFDRIFMAHRLSDWNLPLVGRYSVNTTFGFLLGGAGLLLLRKKSGWPWAEILGGSVLIVFYLSLIGQLLGASALYDHVMAIHTALLFGFLGVAITCGAVNNALLGIVLSPFAGAVASRKMIVAVVLLLPLLGMVEVWAEAHSLVSLRLGTALAVIVTVFLFSVFALRTAAVLNDTDEKRLDTERALLRSSQIATAGRMAASIAHEVNNPLEAVTNILFLLKSDDLPMETRHRYLDVAEKELTRVSAIARRTLGFYREDAHETEFDLRDLVDGALNIYRNKIADRFTVTCEFCENTMVVARAGEVQQILMNLLANAIDAAPAEAATLKITLRNHEGLTLLEIRDNGHGIPKENLNHIFEPFFTTKKEFGTGLGLWVTKELVVKNKGAIRVFSSTDESDHGTMFELSFPSVVRPAPPSPDPLAERVGSS